ncbi:PTS sugar transporter subunit IIC [Streptococcus sp. DD13]|uniref:PTS sugar transporter subunit IIC n=1 Tax=Streptococcus sp. DD13 TaxID=1777881 RepID=UPI000796D2B1|nr:PTS sugar transporter subunit IIC [Streptococcus sp. DD13]KXT77277.1 PTS cellobiose-specific IIC component [Streptococcus sp. DD13]
MKDKTFISQIVKIRNISFVKILQMTLVSLFPFLLLTTITLTISESIFTEGGFINSLFSVYRWFPAYPTISRMLLNFTTILGGLAGPMTTYFAAKYTAGYYERSTGTAGITAFLFSLLFHSRGLFGGLLTDGNFMQMSLPVNINLVVAILIGYAIGQIFRFSNPLDDQIVDSHFVYRPKTLLPIGISMFLAVGLNFLVDLVWRSDLLSDLGSFLQANVLKTGSSVGVWINSFFRSISVWIGNSNPFNEGQLSTDAQGLENLQTALANQTSKGIPYLFSETNLYDAYGAVAGVGGMFALLIAILLVSNSTKNKSISMRSIFPALFHHVVPFMVGIPVVFNVLYLLPVLFIPMVNMVLAAVLLGTGLVPPSVYPIPNGTPSILRAFVGSVGSLRALLASLLIFTVDVLIWIYFVKRDNRIGQGITRYDQKEETGEQEK